MKTTNSLITNNLDLKRNKNNLLKYSSAFKNCSIEVCLYISNFENLIIKSISKASVYAKCVINTGDNLKNNTCLKEFSNLKNCIQNVSVNCVSK
jgi:hypothetical protein